MEGVSGKVPRPRREEGKDGRLSNRHISSVSASSSPPEETSAAPVELVEVLLLAWMDVSTSRATGAQAGMRVKPVSVTQISEARHQKMGNSGWLSRWLCHVVVLPVFPANAKVCLRLKVWRRCDRFGLERV